MKLSRRLLIPIILVSFFAVGLCGIVYYRVMENQIDTIYRGEIRATLARLEDVMSSTLAVNEQVMERADRQNMATAKAVAQFIAEDPEAYLQQDALRQVALDMDVDVICVVDGNGANFACTDDEYLGQNMAEWEGYGFLFDHLGDEDFDAIMAPELSSTGTWIQYYVVRRADAPGLVMAGIEYSVNTILRQDHDYGINPELAKLGETGVVAVLNGGAYGSHPDKARIGEDVSGTPWYQTMAAAESGVDWMEIDGKTYLVGFSHHDADTTLLALLPYEEYSAPLRNMRWFILALVLLSSAIIIAGLAVSLRRNVIRPLAALTQSVRCVARGDYIHARIEQSFRGEMEELRRGLNSSVAQLKGRQENIYANYPGVIWSCDEEFTCTLSAGQAMGRMEYNPQFYLGRNLLEAVRETGDEESAQMIERTFTEGPQRMNKTIGGRYLSMTTSQIKDPEGKVVGMVGVAADVTDMHELQTRLMETTAEAERASVAKTEFLSRMSHEIRTPMNAIIGMNTIARKSEDPEKILYCLDKIQIASDQLLRLINDILDMSKIEANKFEISETEFDFERMLQNVCNVVEINTAEKRQNFIIDFTDVFTHNVVTDELRLSQVLINLLNNAVKFTPEEGNITLRIRNEEVRGSLVRFHFDVIDNGIGIPAEEHQRLFSSFEQADGSITRRYGGTGLGLAICKNIIHMLGGEIALESVPGQGSRFSFSIDAKWGGEKTTSDLIRRLPEGDNRVLVIDDSEDVCLYFESILDAYHFRCDTAQNGPEGVQMVHDALDAGKPYSLIFVDWMMQGMDGIETARHIKSMVPPETIVIMISVADWSEIEAEANSIGVDRFLAKPVLPTALFQSIMGWLNTAEEQRAAAVEAEDKALFHGKRMLLAEDIDINREIILGMLEGTGLIMDSAADGGQALEKYLAAPTGYDLILMDIQMPVMDGYETTRKIRGSGVEGCRDIPIVAMTANAFTSDVEKCLEAGMDDHVAKPVNINDLYLKIRTALRRAGQPKAEA